MGSVRWLPASPALIHCCSLCPSSTLGRRCCRKGTDLSFFCFGSAGCRLLLLQGHGWIQNHGNLGLQKGFYFSPPSGAVLKLVERFLTLLKLRYFCHLCDSGKFPFAHIGVVSKTPNPLISGPVEAAEISPIAEAVLKFKFFCGTHSMDSGRKARDGPSSGLTKRTCVLSVICSLNLHPPLAGKLQIRAIGSSVCNPMTSSLGTGN